VELKGYLRIIRRRWWVVLTTVLVATLGAVALVMPQPSVYESTGTMLIRPIAGSEADAIDASDLLIRGVKIGSTYATVAGSDLIRKRAEAVVDPSVDTSGLDVSAELVTDTNIVSMSVRGTDPGAVQALAVAIQQEMEAYVASVDDTYALVPLDEPKVPRSPVAPNKVLTVVVGMLLGLFAGVGLVLLEQYIRSSGAESSVAQVVDPRTGLHNEAYVRERLHEETSRAQRTGHGFSFVVLRVVLERGENGDIVSAPPRRDLRRVGHALKLSSLPEAVLGYLGNSTFAAVLPDVRSEEAEELLPVWESAAASVFSGNGEGLASSLRVSTGACHYRDDRFVGDREALHVASALVDEHREERRAGDEVKAPRPAPQGSPESGSSNGHAEGPVDPARPARPVPEPVAVPRRDRRDPRRRREGWKGSGSAGDRTG